MIKYITGRAGSGKSAYIMADIKQKLEYGAKNIYVIVPDQYTYETEKQLVDSLGGLMYVEVLSLKRLLYRILQAAGGSKEHYVSSQGRAMLILKAIKNNDIELTVLKKAARGEAFYKNMSELIANFKRFCVEPEDLFSAINEINDAMAKEKLKDIASVYAAMESVIAPYKDSEDVLKEAAVNISGADFLRGAHVYIDGFETTASAMNVMVEALLSVCDSVNISFRMGEGNDSELFSIERGMIQGFRNIAEKLGVEEEIVFLPQSGQALPERDRELSHLESQYFAYPFETCDESPSKVQIYIAENTIKEAEHIARSILNLAREGYKYSDIAVIVPEIKEQGRIMARALREHEVAYYMDEKKSIYESPMPQFILKSLSMAKSGFNSDDMLALLKTGLLCGKDTQSNMCHYIIEKGIEGYKFTRPFEAYRDMELEPERERIVCAYQTFIDNTKEAKTYEHILRALYELIGELNVTQNVQETIDQFALAEENEIASIQTQCYNACMEALDNAVIYLKNMDVSVEALIDILKAGFSIVEIGIIPGHGDAVLVGDIKRSMAGEIKVLFIMGCQEGILPRVPDSGLLLSDDDVNMLKETGIIAGNDGRYIEAQDNMSLYRALSKPSELLCVSYALKDAGEKVMRPSSIISRIKELFPNIKQQSFSQQKQIEYITAPLPTAIYVLGQLRQYIESGQMAPEIKEAYRQLQYMDIKDVVSVGEQALYYDGIRQASSQLEQETVSASRIETFAKCPFMYLSQYILKPVIVQPYELTPISQGMFFHQCLDSFTKTYLLGADLNSYSDDELKKHIKEVIEKTANDQTYLMLRENARNEYMIKRAEELVFGTAYSVYEYLKNSKFRLENSELAFKNIDGYKLSDHATLEGVIDRVDVFEQGGASYYSIIDYKSSAKTIDYSEVYNGLSLQPLLYLNALIDSKKREGIDARAAGAFYLKVDDPIVSISDDLSDINKAQTERYKLSGVRTSEMEIADALDPKRTYIPGDKSSFALSGKELNNLLNFADKKAVDILYGIKNGVSDISPIKKAGEPACKYCNYRNICGYDEALHIDRPITKYQKDALISEVLKEDSYE